MHVLELALRVGPAVAKKRRVERIGVVARRCEPGAAVELLGEAVAAHLLLHVGVVLEEDRLERHHQRQVEPVEPDHRLVPVVVVVVPLPVRGEDQVAGLHLAGVAVDRRVDARAGHDEADRGRRVTVGRRALARPEVLDGAPERRAREGQAVEPRIGEREHTAVAAALDRDDLAGALGKREDGVPFPEPRLRARERNVGHDLALQAPEGLQVVGGKRPAELVVADLDRVRAVDVDAHSDLLLLVSKNLQIFRIGFQW